MISQLENIIENVIYVVHARLSKQVFVFLEEIKARYCSLGFQVHGIVCTGHNYLFIPELLL